MDIYLFFDRISRGACYLTDDGPVFIEQGIQQRGLTRIGSAGNDRLHTLFDDIAQAETIDQLIEYLFDPVTQYHQFIAVGELHIFFTEVQFEFYHGSESNELVPQF